MNSAGRLYNFCPIGASTDCNASESHKKFGKYQMLHPISVRKWKKVVGGKNFTAMIRKMSLDHSSQFMYKNVS